jgi:hypothetical protein
MDKCDHEGGDLLEAESHRFRCSQCGEAFWTFTEVSNLADQLRKERDSALLKLSSLRTDLGDVTITLDAVLQRLGIAVDDPERYSKMFDEIDSRGSTMNYTLDVELDNMPEGWVCFAIGEGKPCIAPPPVADEIKALGSKLDTALLEYAHELDLADQRTKAAESRLETSQIELGAEKEYRRALENTLRGDYWARHADRLLVELTETKSRLETLQREGEPELWQECERHLARIKELEGRLDEVRKLAEAGKLGYEQQALDGILAIAGKPNAG